MGCQTSILAPKLVVNTVFWSTGKSWINGVLPAHGGEVQLAAKRVGLGLSLPDSSALARAMDLRRGVWGQCFRDYPDRTQALLCKRIALLHGVHPTFVLPGNGAAGVHLARDAAEHGLSVLAAPGFATTTAPCVLVSDLPSHLPLLWDEAFPATVPEPGTGSVLWIYPLTPPVSSGAAPRCSSLERYARDLHEAFFLRCPTASSSR